MASSFLNHGTAYPGGKGKSYQHIINVMPPHERYVESHLGAGSVMRFNGPPGEVSGLISTDASWTGGRRSETPT